MFNVRCWTFKKCFTLPLTSVFYSRRNGRTYPVPPLEAAGLDQTKIVSSFDGGGSPVILLETYPYGAS